MQRAIFPESFPFFQGSIRPPFALKNVLVYDKFSYVKTIDPFRRPPVTLAVFGKIGRPFADTAARKCADADKKNKKGKNLS